MSPPLVALLASSLIATGGCRDTPAPSPPPIVAPSPPATAPAVRAEHAPAGDAVRPARDGWITLSPPGEGFSVDLPSTPTREVKQVEGAQGHVAELIQYLASSDELALIVSTSPLVQQLVEHGDRELALDRTLASQTDQPGRAVRHKRRITLGDAIGREAEIDVTIQGQATRLRVEIFMRGARIFQALAIWPVSGETAPPAVERFFSSFSLTGDEVQAGDPIDLWRDFTLTELDLVVSLPKRPEVHASSPTETFVGETIVTTMSAQTAFPPSVYTIDVAPVPAGRAGDRDDALFARWKEGRLAGLPGESRPRLVREHDAALAGSAGHLLELSDQSPDGVSRYGQLIAIVERGADDKARRVVVASVWAADHDELAGLARRFFDGIRRTPR